MTRVLWSVTVGGFGGDNWRRDNGRRTPLIGGRKNGFGFLWLFMCGVGWGARGKLTMRGKRVATEPG